MQPHLFGLDLVGYCRCRLKAQPLLLRPFRQPGQRDIRHHMVIGIESADITMTAGEDHFLARPAAIQTRREANDVEIPSMLIAGDRMAGETDVVRAIRRDIDPHRRIDRIPQSEAFDLHSEAVEPFGEVARQQGAAREAEKKDLGIGKRGVGLLKPATGGAQDRAAIRAEELAKQIGPEMRSGACFKVKGLCVVIDAKVLQPRDIGQMTFDALPSALEEEDESRRARRRGGD